MLHIIIMYKYIYIYIHMYMYLTTWLTWGLHRLTIYKAMGWIRYSIYTLVFRATSEKKHVISPNISKGSSQDPLQHGLRLGFCWANEQCISLSIFARTELWLHPTCGSSPSRQMPQSLTPMVLIPLNSRNCSTFCKETHHTKNKTFIQSVLLCHKSRCHR